MLIFWTPRPTESNFIGQQIIGSTEAEAEAWPDDHRNNYPGTTGARARPSLISQGGRIQCMMICVKLHSKGNMLIFWTPRPTESNFTGQRIIGSTEAEAWPDDHRNNYLGTTSARARPSLISQGGRIQ
ncbi:hypothetical protein V6N13_127203 [Hibiscus sabdariffa]|uniref:Uncharacterized protein n=1 Tax=Hibiscus sabdariffa TaxID=183260 RepID=A0ABR2RDQ2_9ROSI